MCAYGLQAVWSAGDVGDALILGTTKPVIKPETVVEAVSALMGRARVVAADFEPQHVANLLWSVARLHRHSEEVGRASPVTPLRHSVVHLAEVFASTGLRDLSRFSTQNVANTMWALAVLGHRPPESVLGAAGEHFSCHSPRYRPQEVATLLWAFTDLGTRPRGALLTQFWEVVDLKLEQYKHAELAMVSLALARCGGGAPDTWARVVGAWRPLVRSMGPKSLVNCLWAGAIATSSIAQPTSEW